MPRLSSFTGFLPYIAIVFLNAFVDLGHKIVVQNTIFKVYDGNEQIILTAIVNALILLPFILLFSPAGFLSDKYPKHKVMRYSAWAAVAATLLITACYYAGWFWAAFALTLALAIQSALYSPAKYGYIKELVGQEPLTRANGAVQATTITGILLGTFVFSGVFEWLLIDMEQTATQPMLQQIAPIGWLLVLLSVIELVLCYRLPAKTETRHEQKFSAKRYTKLEYLKTNLKTLRKRPVIWQSIIGLATFWAISQVILAAFPAFAKASLGETNTVVIQGILACTGLGIIIGSMIAGRVSRNYIEIGLVPIGAIGITLVLALIPTLDSSLSLGFSFLTLGIMGGLFIIPLNALIQFHADENELGTVLAGNNWIQNVTMLSFLVLTVVVAMLDISSQLLLGLLAIVALAGTGYTVRMLSHSFARLLVTFLFKGRYKIDVDGFKNIPSEGPTLLLGNHISWIDWALVQIACPRKIRFVMQKEIYNIPFIRPILKVFGVIPIAKGHSEDALQTINQLLREGEVVCLFPEGAISRNGQLGKFHTGFERAAAGLTDTNAVIIPFYLRGLWGSKFSRSSQRLRESRMPSGFRRQLLVAFGNPIAIDTTAEQLKQSIFQLSIDAWQSHTDTMDSIPLTWIKNTHRSRFKTAATDSGGKPMSSQRLLSEVIITTKAMRLLERNIGDNHNNLGVLLPSSCGNLITNMAILMNGHSTVNLPYCDGINAEEQAHSLQEAIDLANIETIYTSHNFYKEIIAANPALESVLLSRQLIFISDIRKTVSPLIRACITLASALLPASWLYRSFGRQSQLDDPAVIAFNRGPEQDLQGVMLSHRNIVANCRQIGDLLNPTELDVIMGCLPPSHAFGLTMSSLLPALESIPVIFHSNTDDSLGLAKTIARKNATFLCAPDSLLNALASHPDVHGLSLNCLNQVVSGGEKLTEATRDLFQTKFNKQIFEGYGCTETTPVASANLPDAIDTSYWRVQVGHKPGSAGLPLPGTAFKIVDKDTLTELPVNQSGEILISGSQLMLGYLNNQSRSEEVIVEMDDRRWFRTGDLGYLDSEGFLTLVP